MSARPVQVSIDEKLLRRIDADRETRQKGRSAFIRSAAELYLHAKARREIDDAIARAYDGKADALLTEMSDLMRSQAWPKK